MLSTSLKRVMLPVSLLGLACLVVSLPRGCLFILILVPTGQVLLVLLRKTLLTTQHLLALLPWSIS